ENKLYGSPIQPVKLFYFMQLFRYERPQQGRMRQLNQFGVEVLGSADPSVDAEVIALAMTCYKELGLSSLKLVLNSLGDKESRQNHRKALVEHFSPYKDELCSDCQKRLNQNPLRILDCKTDRDHPAMKTAPSILDYLNEYSEQYFNQVKAYLDMMEIPYVIDQNLVRGLDYYNHTAFEIMCEAEGFGDIMSLAVGETAEKQASELVHKLRVNGIQVDKDYQGRKMKAQFKAADRLKAKYVIILGDNELEDDIVNVKNMKTGDQTEVPLTDLVKTM